MGNLRWFDADPQHNVQVAFSGIDLCSFNSSFYAKCWKRFEEAFGITGEQADERGSSTFTYANNLVD